MVDFAAHHIWLFTYPPHMFHLFQVDKKSAAHAASTPGVGETHREDPEQGGDQKQILGAEPDSLPWKITMLLIGKASICMGHLYHGYVK